MAFSKGRYFIPKRVEIGLFCIAIAWLRGNYFKGTENDDIGGEEVI